MALQPFAQGILNAGLTTTVMASVAYQAIRSGDRITVSCATYFKVYAAIVKAYAMVKWITLCQRAVVQIWYIAGTIGCLAVTTVIGQREQSGQVMDT